MHLHNCKVPLTQISSHTTFQNVLCSLLLFLLYFHFANFSYPPWPLPLSIFRIAGGDLGVHLPTKKDIKSFEKKNFSYVESYICWRMRSCISIISWQPFNLFRRTEEAKEAAEAIVIVFASCHHPEYPHKSILNSGSHYGAIETFSVRVSKKRPVPHAMATLNMLSKSFRDVP